MAERFDIQGTPTLVIFDTNTGQMTKLEGNEKITKQAILEAMRD